MNSEILEFLNSGCLLSMRSPNDLLSTEVSKDLPNSLSRSVKIGWGPPVRAAHPAQSARKLSVYSPDFFLKDPLPWWIFPFSKTVSAGELSAALEEFAKKDWEWVRGLEWVQPDFDFFKTVFLDLKDQFQKGNLKKAVPVVFEKAELELTVSHRASLLLKILKNTQGIPVHLYGIWDSKEGMLGATPEILFCQNSESRLETVALAGTRLKTPSSGAESTVQSSLALPSATLPLLEDPKELEEHRIVVEGIRTSLAELGRVIVGETGELVLPTLSHLFTPIFLDLDLNLNELMQTKLDESEPRLKPELERRRPGLARPGRFFEEVVARLHPTPALGAFPREEGAVWLRDFQKRMDRFRMGAPFGIFGIQADDSNGFESCCVVCIRNLQWKASTLFLGAGCGIISASRLDREWTELLGKIQSIKKSFGLEVV